MREEFGLTNEFEITINQNCPSSKPTWCQCGGLFSRPNGRKHRKGKYVQYRGFQSIVIGVPCKIPSKLAKNENVKPYIR